MPAKNGSALRKSVLYYIGEGYSSTERKKREPETHNGKTDSTSSFPSGIELERGD